MSIPSTPLQDFADEKLLLSLFRLTVNDQFSADGFLVVDALNTIRDSDRIT